VSPVTDNDLRAIRQGMFGVVNEGGTGGRARLGEVGICGKTGTSQIASTAVAQESQDERLRPNAWFVGFAPCEAPEIVVAALYENGEHGHFAAPIARDVLKAYFDKKARLEWTRREPPRPGPSPPEATRAALEPFRP
jgi:penicillin-binding protein 2